MLALKEFRSKLKGLADLLNYAALVDEGILLGKDGSLLCAFYFRGEDLDSATHSELATMSAQINAALVKLGSGWMLNIDSLRIQSITYTPREQCFFQDATTALIDEERRQQNHMAGAHFENIYALCITYLPPPDYQSKISSFFIEDDTKNYKGTKDNFGIVLEKFKTTVAELRGSFSARLQIRPMSSEELLTYLHSTLTGLTHLVRVPAIPMYLDRVLATKDFYTGLAPRIGTKHIRVITLFGFPGETTPGILDILNRLPMEYRWSTRFIALDPLDANKMLNVYRKNWFQKRQGMMGLLKSAMGGGEQTWANSDAVRMAVDADTATNEASEGSVRFGYYTSVIVVMNDDLATAEEHAKTISKDLGNCGFASFVEDMNAVEAFLGSLPGHGFANVRRPLIHSLNLADLLPLTSVWPGPDKHPCNFYPKNSPPLFYAATNGSTPFRASLHVSDLGHTVILGPPGSGKSTLLGLIMAQQFRYPAAQVFCFDKGSSAFVLAKAALGEHYDIGGEDSQLSFCPLASLDTDKDRAWAKEYIEILLTIQLKEGEVLSPSQRDEIHLAIERMSHSTTLSRERTLTNLKNTLQDKFLRDALGYYTVDGTLGHLLDAEQDSLRTQRFQVFEMEHLMGMGEKALIPVLLYLFHQLEKRFTGAPTLLVLDEAWIMLKHPIFREKIREWLKVLRKANVAVVFATQSLSDVMKSPIADVIIESTATKILLPNPEAMGERSAQLYEALGLNEKQIQILATAIQKRHYYLICSEGKRLFDLGLGKVALAFVGISPKEDVPRARELMQQHGPSWVYHWLIHKGVPSDWGDFWHHTNEEMRRKNEIQI
jgi:type IV secretion/conjugal transfer VirB4 family ATPase